MRQSGCCWCRFCIGTEAHTTLTGSLNNASGRKFAVCQLWWHNQTIYRLIVSNAVKLWLSFHLSGNALSKLHAQLELNAQNGAQNAPNHLKPTVWTCKQGRRQLHLVGSEGMSHTNMHCCSHVASVIDTTRRRCFHSDDWSCCVCSCDWRGTC